MKYPKIEWSEIHMPDEEVVDFLNRGGFSPGEVIVMPLRSGLSRVIYVKP